MADTADRVAKAYDEKIDPNRLIPIGEAFNIISFGVSALKQTSDGIKNSFKDRLAQKEKINADKKIQSARLLNAKKQADKRTASCPPAKPLVSVVRASSFSPMM